MAVGPGVAPRAEAEEDLGQRNGEISTRFSAASPAIRRLTAQLHACGPRPVGEVIGLGLLLLSEPDRVRVLDEIERIVNVGPAVVAALDARDWPARALTMLAGGRR